MNELILIAKNIYKREGEGGNYIKITPRGTGIKATRQEVLTAYAMKTYGKDYGVSMLNGEWCLCCVGTPKTILINPVYLFPDYDSKSVYRWHQQIAEDG